MMSDDDLDRIEADYARFRGDGVTRTKAVNDVLLLVAEVRRLRLDLVRARRQRDVARNQRDRLEAAWADELNRRVEAEAEAQRDRLRDGIRRIAGINDLCGARLAAAIHDAEALLDDQDDR